MTKNEVIEKIKKCLALSASSNEHEAEIALRQAHALMEKYGVDEADMLAAGVSEVKTKAGATKIPPNWESMLVAKIANAFGCHSIFQRTYFDTSWVFVGCGPSSEIAQYAFQVLYRQLKRQRTDHIKNKLFRCKTATKTRRADLYCEGWVRAVTSKIHALAGSEAQDTQIAAYLAKNYPALTELKSRNRNSKDQISKRDYNDYAAGFDHGRNVDLNHGVDADQAAGLLS